MVRMASNSAPPPRSQVPQSSHSLYSTYGAIIMQALVKTALIAALGLSAFGSFAGEISNTDIRADRADNQATAKDSKAFQHIGVTFGSGKITNSYVYAPDAKNHAFGEGSTAHQDIGRALNGGTMDNVKVYASNAHNDAYGKNSVAEQRIGSVRDRSAKD